MNKRKREFRYVRRAVPVNKKKALCVCVLCATLLAVVVCGYMAADRFARSSAQKIGELSVENAATDIGSILGVGENMVNIVTDFIEKSEMFVEEQAGLQNYLDIVYENAKHDSENVITDVYCYYEGNLYTSNQNGDKTEIENSKAYQETQRNRKKTDQCIYFIDPHEDPLSGEQVISVVRRFGEDDVWMTAVDISVEKLQTYINKYTMDGSNIGGMTNGNYEFFIQDDVKSVPKDEKGSMTPEEIQKQGQKNLDMGALGEGVNHFQVQRGGVQYIIFSKKIAQDWTISYTIAVEELYHEQYQVMRWILVMAVCAMGVCSLFLILISRKEIQYMTDPLTGLLNRRGVKDAIYYRLKKDKQLPKAVVYLDLDDFKQANDAYGHECGDQVLRNTADILHRVKHGLFARMGGDEFAGLIYRADDRKKIEKVCRDISQQIAVPMQFEGKEVRVSSSMGVVLCDGENMQEVEELLKQADEQMYAAKRNGKNQVHIK